MSETPTTPERPPRLDVSGFIATYEWVQRYLPGLVTYFDDVICDQVLIDYPDDVVELYKSLANSKNDTLRELAATRADNVAKVDLEEGIRLLKQLQVDPNPAIAREAHETERDLPFLIRGPERDDG